MNQIENVRIKDEIENVRRKDDSLVCSHKGIKLLVSVYDIYTLV